MPRLKWLPADADALGMGQPRDAHPVGLRGCAPDPVPDRVVRFRARLVAFWHTDLIDPRQMVRLRSRVVWVAAVVGVLSMAVTMVFSPRTYLARSWLVPALTLLALVLIALYVGRRGDRMGEVEFALLIASAQVLATVATDLNQPGLVSRVGLCLMAPVVVAALFAEGLPVLLVQGVVAVACLALVASHAPSAANAGMDVSVGSFALVVVAGVVRLLRELALGALRAARAGEITDPLTDLANRRGLERLGAARWRARARESGPLAVLVIDVDHFKQINDAQGHAAGDETLRQLAELIRSVLRAEDIAVRLGGEEFGVLSSARPGQGVLLAERIRVTVEREFAPVTVSDGVDELVPGLADPLPAAIWSAVDRADRALYAAKKAGRNRVVAGTPVG